MITSEQTPLTPTEEAAFQEWVKANGITDVDHPDSKYDYRGHYKASGGKPIRAGVDHFPDTYKQHGHPTFSQESKYSRGPADGGMWMGETFIPQPKMAVSHLEQQLLNRTLRKK